MSKPSVSVWFIRVWHSTVQCWGFTAISFSVSVSLQMWTSVRTQTEGVREHAATPSAASTVNAPRGALSDKMAEPARVTYMLLLYITWWAEEVNSERVLKEHGEVSIKLSNAFKSCLLEAKRFTGSYSIYGQDVGQRFQFWTWIIFAFSHDSAP